MYGILQFNVSILHLSIKISNKCLALFPGPRFKAITQAGPLQLRTGHTEQEVA